MYKFSTFIRVVTVLTFTFSFIGFATSSPLSISQEELISRMSSPIACLDFISKNKDIEYNWVEIPLHNGNLNKESSRLQFYYWKKELSQEKTSSKESRKIKSVFINGGPINNSHSSYELVKDFIDSSVLFFDQRGTGCSEKYSEASSINEFGSRGISRDLSLLLNHLKVDKVIVVGHSYGVKIAQRFTSLNPHRVSKIYTYADFALGPYHEDQFKDRYDSYLATMDKRRVDFAAIYPEEDKKITFLEMNLSKDHCIADTRNSDNVLCGIESIFILNWWLSNPNSYEVSAEWINFLVQEDKINFENLYKFTTRNSFKNYSMLTAAMKEKEYYFKSNIDECLKIDSTQSHKLNSMCLQIWPLMRWQNKNGIDISYDPILKRDFMQTLLDHDQVTAWHYTGAHDSRTSKAIGIITTEGSAPGNFKSERVEYGHWEYLATTSFWSKVLE
jgi:hypothetical protein